MCRGISPSFYARGCLAAAFLGVLLAFAPYVPGQTPPTLTTLYNFSPVSMAFNAPFNADGASPLSGVVRGLDGNFYGTTTRGGSGANGTVFRLTPAGDFTTLYNFHDGAYPIAGLVRGRDGNFYGTTNGGGTGRNGTIFRITPAGVLTVLHDFKGGDDGSVPIAGLIQGVDGNFYGTTAEGGTPGLGTVFAITPAGALTTLHTFDGSDGAEPSGRLARDGDGNLYGTTYGTAAPALSGTVFRLTPAGTFTVLYAFSPLDADGHNTDGANPLADLIEGRDGNFYSTTQQGGTDGNGTIFKITPAGVFATVDSFVTSAGQDSGLIQGVDGNFYGTTENGGTDDSGQIFQLTPAGVLTSLYSFSGADGANPYTALIQDSDGTLYGTTQYGGAGGSGTVFAFNLNATPTPVVPTVTIYAGEGGRIVEGGAAGKVFVRRTGDTSASLTVFYKVQGSARPGVELRPLSGTVTIPAGAVRTGIRIEAIDNRLDAGTRLAKVKLKPSPDGSYVLGSAVVARIEVIDND